MKSLLLLTVTSALALGLMGGCGDDDDGGGSGGSGGATGGTGGGGTGGGGTGGGGTGGGGTGGGGTGGGGTGGIAGGGGTAGGGTGGIAGGGGTAGADGGGAAGMDGGGAAGADGGGTDAGDGGTAFWAAAYNANCAPSSNAPAGHTPTNQTLDCLICHKAGGAAASKPFIFGGVVWTSSAATAGAPKVEVGVRDGSNFLYACSDTNGFFWVPTAGNTAPTWTTAEIRMRSSDTAEKKMNTKTIQAGTCNASGCHVALKLVKP